jgi:hypothetical protein
MPTRGRWRAFGSRRDSDGATHRAKSRNLSRLHPSSCALRVDERHLAINRALEIFNSRGDQPCIKFRAAARRTISPEGVSL